MKMKIKVALLSTLVFLLPSCSKWLDVKLPNVVDEQDLFSTVDGFHEAMAGVYSKLAGSTLYGRGLTMEYLDIYAQYYGAPGGTTDVYYYHHAFDYNNEGVAKVHGAIWNEMYSAISGANNIIRWANTNSSVLSESEYDQFVGEATAIRAFVHFDLIRMFCPDVKAWGEAEGIPYNKVFGVSLPPQYTVAECVQLVLNDLIDAEKLLAADPTVDEVPYTMSNKNDADKYVARMNLYAVKALKARLHLMRGEYTKAIAAAREVVESDKFRLLDFSSVDAVEASLDILFSDEHIFSLRNKKITEYSEELHHSKDNGTTFQNAPLVFSNPGNVYDLNNDDQRNVKWFTTSDDETSESPRGQFRKYTVENTEAFYRKVPVIKLSEMYLILAECYFSTDPHKALEYLNMLRDHRIRNNVPWTYIARDFIVNEMKREFLGEGQLWFAYKRLNMPIPTETLEGEIAPSNAIFVFPMPKKEIENGHRTQNE